MTRFRIMLAIAAGAASLAAIVEAAETITYGYDAKGRLTKVEHTGAVNNGVVANYTHDRADNRTRVKVTGAP